MWQLAAAFAEIALRRHGPESLPDSAFLVMLVLLVDFAVYLVELGFYGGLDALGLLLFALDTVLLFGFVYAVLMFFRLERRFRQTIAAMIGADIFVTLAFLPIAGFAALTGQDLLAEPFLLLRLGFLFWMIYIAASILARSLNQPLIVGLGFEILYLCLTLSVAYLVSPELSALDAPSG